MKRGFAALAVVGVVAAVGVIALSGISFAGVNFRYSSDSAFNNYLAKYGKVYSTKEEYYMRKAVFEHQLRIINEHNSQEG